MPKIKATPEGRDGVWNVGKADILDWLKQYPENLIHNFIPNGSLMLGCDYTKESVVDEINKSERIAILTGDSLKVNMNHSLSVIVDNKLTIFDIGEITDADIENKLAA